MKNIFKKIGYYLSLPFVGLAAILSALSCKRLAKKYLKKPKEVFLEDRLKRVYKAFKKYLYIKRIKVVAEGLDNVHQRQHLFIPNHKSNADPIVLFVALYEAGKMGPISFVAKAELEQVWAARYCLQLLDGIFLQRDNGRSIWECYNKQNELLRNGQSVVVFPEGTRVDGDNFLEFKPATLKVAYDSFVPIEPVAIYGTEKSNMKKQFKTQVSISFLKPILPNNFINIKQEQLMISIQNSIFEKYNEMKAKPLVETKE